MTVERVKEILINYVDNDLESADPDYVKETLEEICTEEELKELRTMKEGVIKALASISETDSHGNVRAYRYDTAINEIRKAVYPTDWEYNVPFEVVR